MLRALREAEERAREGEAWSSGGRLASPSSTAATPLHGGTEVVPLLRAGDPARGRCSSTSAAWSRAGSTARRSAPARRSPSSRRAEGPGGAARGVPAGREPAAPEHGLARRQPAAVDALLVLAPQLAVPAARRRRVLRAGGRAPRARDLRQRLLRVGPSVRRRGGAARARRDARARPARAADRRALPRPDRGRPADDDARAWRAASSSRGPAVGRVGLPEGDGAQALGVPARRGRGGAHRRDDARRARRRRPDSLAARRERPRRRDTAAAERLQGRDREARS